MVSLLNPKPVPNPSTPTTAIKPSFPSKPFLRIPTSITCTRNICSSFLRLNNHKNKGEPRNIYDKQSSINNYTTRSTCSRMHLINCASNKHDIETSHWPPKVWELLSKLRQTSPLVQCITNYVSMDLVANTLLSAGASPAMVHAVEEAHEFTPRAHALYINVGTLDGEWLACMTRAAAIAGESGKTWVLDPVAAGASGFRLRACLELVGLGPTVIRGNGSEIIALARAAVGDTKGADSMHDSIDALEAAKSLALSSNAIVAVSGAVDIVTDGRQVIGVYNGVPMMQKITATGCSVTALIAAFVAADPTQAFEATASALSTFGIAGELGQPMAQGPASLRVSLIDSLYGLDEESILRRAKISRLS